MPDAFSRNRGDGRAQMYLGSGKVLASDQDVVLLFPCCLLLLLLLLLPAAFTAAAAAALDFAAAARLCFSLLLPCSLILGAADA